MDFLPSSSTLPAKDASSLYPEHTSSKNRTITALCQKFIEDGVLSQVERYVKNKLVTLTALHETIAEEKCLELVRTQDTKTLKRYYNLGLIDNFFNKKIYPEETIAIKLLRSGEFHFIENLLNKGYVDDELYVEQIYYVYFSNIFFHCRVSPCPHIALFMVKDLLDRIIDSNHKDFCSDILNNFSTKLIDNCEILKSNVEDIEQQSKGYPFFSISPSNVISLFAYNARIYVPQDSKNLSSCKKVFKFSYVFDDREVDEYTEEEEIIKNTEFIFPYVKDSIFFEYAILLPVALTRLQKKPITLDKLCENFKLTLNILKWFMQTSAAEFLSIDNEVESKIEDIISICDLCMPETYSEYLSPKNDPLHNISIDEQETTSDASTSSTPSVCVTTGTTTTPVNLDS